MTAWASETLLATGLLAGLVLILRIPVARLFGARAAYALWLAPLLRLLLPPLPADSPVPGLTILAGPATTLAPAAPAAGLGLPDLLLAVWIGGAIAFLLFHATAHRRFLARAIAQGRTLPGRADGPELIESDAVEGPIATGLVRRRIIVPAGFGQTLTAGQCRLAIAHEELHHRRGDLWALALSMLLLALHWFNPLAHLAHRLFRRDLEAACDAELVERLGAKERADYARAIVGCAAAPTPKAICTLTSIEDLKRRLIMLQWNHGSIARAAGLGCAAMVAFGGLALTAPAGAQTTETEEVETQKRIEIRRIVGSGEDSEGHADLRAAIAECDGERFEASSAAPSDGDRKERTKVVLCMKGTPDAAELADKLERAAGRIEQEEHLSGETKAEILAQLRARIAELRAR